MLNSFPTSFMSGFRMPIGVANKIEKLQRSFLWGNGIEKKNHAVNWASVCKNKMSGGLGIGRMVDKNISLLAKWVWRFSFDRDSLWKKVVCAKYGIQAVVGKGSNIRLWHDVVNDGFPLKVAFPRIFALAVNQEGFINVLQKFGMGVDGCKMCNQDLETLNHTFLHCVWSWKVWVQGLCWWGVEVSPNRDINGWWESWKERCVDPRKRKNQAVEAWVPSRGNVLKFNVDGFSLGNPGSAAVSLLAKVPCFGSLGLECFALFLVVCYVLLLLLVVGCLGWSCLFFFFSSKIKSYL
ncbi:hypothetical protein Ddye_014432 [Dipteronia dyeriana]|uniref:Reverse transcriptase zinc-binding domain-containing protein n=1 Tax=Dipteronia dyeriana TaxID=168575 RepID=A0AAD9X8C6_9ROSI|nr:hypothetical protein Ddye_014432 [Dipteronia dyeriana]